jgi:hypothetical protein
MSILVAGAAPMDAANFLRVPHSGDSDDDFAQNLFDVRARFVDAAEPLSSHISNKSSSTTGCPLVLTSCWSCSRCDDDVDSDAGDDDSFAASKEDEEDDTLFLTALLEADDSGAFRLVVWFVSASSSLGVLS